MWDICNPFTCFRHKFCIYRRGVLCRKILYIYKFYVYEYVSIWMLLCHQWKRKDIFLSLNICCVDYSERHTVELNVIFSVICRQCHCVGGSSVILLVLFFIVFVSSDEWFATMWKADATSGNMWDETPIALILVGPVFVDRCSWLSNCGFFVYIVLSSRILSQGIVMIQRRINQEACMVLFIPTDHMGKNRMQISGPFPPPWGIPTRKQMLTSRRDVHAR